MTETSGVVDKNSKNPFENASNFIRRLQKDKRTREFESLNRKAKLHEKVQNRALELQNFKKEKINRIA